MYVRMYVCRGGPEQRGLVRGEVGGEADAGAGGQTAEVAGGDCVQEQFSSAEGGKVSKEQIHWGEDHRGEHFTRAKSGEAAGGGSGSVQEVAVVAKVTSATSGKVSKECFHSAEKPHQEQVAVAGESAQESAQEQVTKEEPVQEPNTWGASSITCVYFDISQGDSAEQDLGESVQATGGTGGGSIFLNAIIWAAEEEAAEWQQQVLAAEGEVRCTGTLGDAHKEQFFLCATSPGAGEALHGSGQCQLEALEEQGWRNWELRGWHLFKHAGVVHVVMNRWRAHSMVRYLDDVCVRYIKANLADEEGT